MSNPNNFNNNLFQTPLHDAYYYKTYSPYILNMPSPKFSSVCIFCSSPESMALVQDGSFRQCYSCKKHFKAKPK